MQGSRFSSGKKKVLVLLLEKTCRIWKKRWVAIQHQTKMVDRISRAAYAKYWVAAEYNQQRIQEDTLK